MYAGLSAIDRDGRPTRRNASGRIVLLIERLFNVNQFKETRAFCSWRLHGGFGEYAAMTTNRTQVAAPHADPTGTRQGSLIVR